MADPLTSYPWADDYELGHAQMDDTHREFVSFIDDLLRAGDDEFPPLLARFATHTQQHFDQELAWMNETGFPPVGCQGQGRSLGSPREPQAATARSSRIGRYRRMEAVTPR